MAYQQAVSHHASTGLEWLARAGYAARGAVYFLIGGLALWSVFGSGGQTTGSRGALATLQDEPFGQFLLALIAIGLLGYAVWRMVQGVADADDHGTDGKGLVIRGGLIVSAITHLSLAIYTASLVLGGGGSSGGSSSQSWTAELMQNSWGRWLVGLIGLAIIGAGIAQFVKGYKASFLKHFKVSAQQLGAACKVCRFGLIARGVVFAIIGWFFIDAAISYNPQEARGLAGAFDAVRSQPWGTFLMILVSLGLVAFGVYSAIEAKYRTVSR